MTKGTPSYGRKNKKTHIACRRCGKHTYHLSKKRCSACGFGIGGSAKMRKFSWQNKHVIKKDRKV
jgi:large subunit ribosomal protein L37e